MSKQWNNAIWALARRLKLRLQQADRFTVIVAAVLGLAALVLLAAGLSGSDPVAEPTRSGLESPADPTAALHAAAGEEAIWQSEAQRTRKWQLAKMATLSNLLTQFPSLARATVIIEPGRSGGLGRQAVAPRAAVTVMLAGDAVMTQELLAAIADVVAAGVAGLDRQAVRVIDARGASYCLAESSLPSRLARTALPVASSPVDALSAPDVHSTSRPSPGTSLWTWMLIAVIAVADVAIVTAVAIRRIRRRRRQLAWVRLRAIARRRQNRAGSNRDDVRPFEMLKQASVDDMVTLLAAEQTETIALALSRLSPARAARVLSRLSGSQQVQVAACMADLDGLDAETVQAAQHDLAERLAQHDDLASHQFGGVAAVARILQHSGQAGRRRVLEALAQQQPRLADSISRQLLSFEDIADLSDSHLRKALADVTPDELAIALRTTRQGVQDRLLASLDEAAAHAVRQRMNEIGPVRLGDVEIAQRHIVEVVRDGQPPNPAAPLMQQQVMA